MSFVYCVSPLSAPGLWWQRECWRICSVLLDLVQETFSPPPRPYISSSTVAGGSDLIPSPTTFCVGPLSVLGVNRKSLTRLPGNSKEGGGRQAGPDPPHLHMCPGLLSAVAAATQGCLQLGHLCRGCGCPGDKRALPHRDPAHATSAVLLWKGAHKKHFLLFFILPSFFSCVDTPSLLALCSDFPYAHPAEGSYLPCIDAFTRSFYLYIFIQEQAL